MRFFLFMQNMNWLHKTFLSEICISRECESAERYKYRSFCTHSPLLFFSYQRMLAVFYILGFTDCVIFSDLTNQFWWIFSLVPTFFSAIIFNSTMSKMVDNISAYSYLCLEKKIPRSGIAQRIWGLKGFLCRVPNAMRKLYKFWIPPTL